MHGGDVVCVAQNDALLEGLLTLIHKERESEFGMSSIQVSLVSLVNRYKALAKPSSLHEGKGLPGHGLCRIDALHEPCQI